VDQGSTLSVETRVEKSSDTLAYGTGRTRRLVGSVAHLGRYLIVMQKISGEWKIVEHFRTANQGARMAHVGGLAAMAGMVRETLEQYIPVKMRRFRAIRAVEIPESQFGNTRHSSATAETKGYWLASHRAADSQPRCRLG
jgi:hypothetical protein